MTSPPLSILDLAFVPAGSTPADALRNTLDLAQHARCGAKGLAMEIAVEMWWQYPAREILGR